MLALSLAGSAYATAPVIPVFSGDGSPPKMFVHEGEQRGVLIDILNYADKQMPQHRFELSLYPWARAYMASASGRRDPVRRRANAEHGSAGAKRSRGRVGRAWRGQGRRP